MPGVVFLFFASLEVWLDALEQFVCTPAHMHMRPFFSNCRDIKYEARKDQNGPQSGV